MGVSHDALRVVLSLVAVVVVGWRVREFFGPKSGQLSDAKYEHVVRWRRAWLLGGILMVVGILSSLLVIVFPPWIKAVPVLLIGSGFVCAFVARLKLDEGPRPKG
jgi:hypothetical protein